MDACDVLIVGGGPAGSSCARQLHASGFDVVVLDKQSFPRDKTCAGWITPAVVDDLQLDLDEYRAGRVFQPITGFRTGMIGGPEVETRYPQPVSFGIRRREFDHYLLQRCGARLSLGESVAELDRDAQGWIVNRRWHAPMLVGAGGNFCPVARRFANAEETAAEVVVAQEIEFELSAPGSPTVFVDAEMPELYFCEDLLGYGWCFKKGNVANIGLGRTDRSKLSEHVQQFWQFLAARGKVSGDPPQPFHGHAYRLNDTSHRQLSAERVLLVGDSAGLASPQSGEGIRQAVESGMMAAEVILAAHGDYSQQQLSAYDAKVHQRFRSPGSSRFTGYVPQAWLRGLAERLLASQWFARHIVLDRWFLQSGLRSLSG